MKHPLHHPPIITTVIFALCFAGLVVDYMNDSALIGLPVVALIGILTAERWIVFLKTRRQP